MMKMPTMVSSFQRRFLFMIYTLPAESVHDRILALISADRLAGDLDPHLVGNLDLHRFLVQFRDLPVDAARW